MIVQKHFLNQLKDFSLNSYEAKLWTALLSRGVATAGELSDIANVPRSRSYDVLESLERKGFVVMKLGKPIKYIAVPPEEVLDRVKKGIKEEADKQTQVIEGLNNSEILNELNTLHKQGINTVEPIELTGAIKGRNNLYNHLNFMVKNAQKRVMIMTTEKGLLRKLDSLKNTLQKAKERGVKTRILAPSGSKSKKLSVGFAQIKTTNQPLSRFCLVDGKQVTLMALKDDEIHPNYDFGVWVNTEFFAKSFENIFEHLWEKAK